MSEPTTPTTEHDDEACEGCETCWCAECDRPRCDCDGHDEDADEGDCPTCGGHGGGPDAALRCWACKGSGASRRTRDLDGSEPEPWEYA